MKKIRLSQIIPGDEVSTYTNVKKMTVFLGPGKLFLFTDVKKANRFLAETNRFINERLHDLNDGYTRIFKEFRDLWFDLSSSETRIVRELIESIDFELELIIQRTDNPNFLVLKKLKGTYQLLIDIANKLKPSAKNLNRRQTYHTLKYYIKIFKIEIESIDNYGNDSEHRHIGPVGLRNPNGIYRDE